MQTSSNMESKSSLAPMIIAGGLVIGAVLAISLLLLLAGFLTAPSLLAILIVFASLGILGVSITAGVLSRRPSKTRTKDPLAR